METYPNQQKIKIEKEKCDTQNLYTKINLRALDKVSCDLKGEAFKMWLYLAKNQDNYILALSKKDCIQWGIGSESSYKRAKAELIQKGYLIEISPNNFIFREIPSSK